MPLAHAFKAAVLAAAAVAIATFGGGAEEAAIKPQPYKPVAIELPRMVEDPGFAEFRKQVVDIAQRNDRAALAKLVANSFFWATDQGKDITDKKRSGFENLVRALYLDNPDSEGWDLLAAFASEGSADPLPQRAGVICGPGEPKYDNDAAAELGKLTGTTAAHWYFPVAEGVEVRRGPAPNAAVIGKLGLHLVWVYPDESPAAAVFNESVRIILPSGQIAYAAIDALSPLPADLLCYVKEGNAWKLAGYFGGLPPAQ